MITIAGSLILTVSLILALGIWTYETSRFLGGFWVMLGLTIGVAGVFGLMTRQIAEGLSSGIKLHQNHVREIGSENMSMGLENTVRVGFSLIAVVGGIVFISLTAFYAGSYFHSLSDVPETFTCSNGMEIPLTKVQDGNHDCDGNFWDGMEDEEEGLYIELTSGSPIFSFLSVIFYVISSLTMVTGLLGLGTKIIADSVSIGLTMNGMIPLNENGEPTKSTGESDHDQDKIIIPCPTCEGTLRVKKVLDSKVRCPKCKGVFELNDVINQQNNIDELISEEPAVENDSEE
jgi:hypothetical protein